MKDSRRSLLVHRILSGLERYVIGGQIYLLHPFTPAQRYLAEEIYEEAYQEACEEGDILDGETHLAWLMEEGLWSPQKEQDLATFQKDLEEAKIRAFQSGFLSMERAKWRQVIAKAREEIIRLTGEKHQLDHTTASGIAHSRKLRFLVGSGLHTSHGKRVWRDDGFWGNTSPLLDQATQHYLACRLGEKDYRLLARTDPWRSYWLARKGADLFSRSSVELTEDQRAMISYAGLYDSIHEHPNSPEDEVIEDDDLLDGWILFQKREQERERKSRQADSLIGNDKIRNSQEVFVVGQNREDFEKIDSMNDPVARARKRQRLNYVQKHGRVAECNMPDTKQNLIMQFNQLEGERMKGK